MVRFLRLIPLRIIKILLKRTVAVIQAITLIGICRTPAHHDSIRKHALAQVIPARSLHSDADSNLFHLLRSRQRNCLTNGIAAGIQHCKCRCNAIFLHNAIIVRIHPSGICKQLFRIIHIGLNHHFRIIPRHSIIF